MLCNSMYLLLHGDIVDGLMEAALYICVKDLHILTRDRDGSDN